jgi:hypothetical protein
MIWLLLVLALMMGGCGFGVERSRSTRVGFGQPDREADASGPETRNEKRYAGIRVITIRSTSGELCTLVFRDGLYIGGTC